MHPIDLNHSPIKIFTDGASKSNPGEASYGFVGFNIDSIEDVPSLLEFKENINIQVDVSLGSIKNLSVPFYFFERIGIKTNNEAEYMGMIEALKMCQKKKIEQADIYMDSNLVVQQMLGKFKVKKPHLQKLFIEAKQLSKNIEVNFFHVRREKNEIADYLANLAFNIEVV